MVRNENEIKSFKQGFKCFISVQVRIISFITEMRKWTISATEPKAKVPNRKALADSLFRRKKKVKLHFSLSCHCADAQPLIPFNLAVKRLSVKRHFPDRHSVNTCKNVDLLTVRRSTKMTRRSNAFRPNVFSIKRLGTNLTSWKLISL
jgi:hypothetical protein